MNNSPILAHLQTIKANPRDWNDPTTVKLLAELLEERINYIESGILPVPNCAYIHSMTIRLYCSCGDAEVIDSDPLGVAYFVDSFTAKHNGPGHSPCTPREAAKVRNRRSRGLENPAPKPRQV